MADVRPFMRRLLPVLLAGLSMAACEPTAGPNAPATPDSSNDAAERAAEVRERQSEDN